MKVAVLKGRNADQWHRIWGGLDPVPVGSSNVKSIGYDQQTGGFFVQFLDGRLYVYDVPATEATAVFTAKSKGAAVWDVLRGANGKRPIRMLDIDTRPYLQVE